MNTEIFEGFINSLEIDHKLKETLVEAIKSISKMDGTTVEEDGGGAAMASTASAGMTMGPGSFGLGATYKNSRQPNMANLQMDFNERTSSTNKKRLWHFFTENLMGVKPSLKCALHEAGNFFLT